MVISRESRHAAPRRAEAEPAAVSFAITRAVEEEQARFSRALHETLCQSLSGMQFLARLLERKLQQAPSFNAPAEWEELSGGLVHALEETHVLNRWLRQPDFRQGTLSENLADLARDISARKPCAFAESGEGDWGEHAPALYNLARLLLRASAGDPATTRLAVELEQGASELSLTVWIEGCSPAAFETPEGKSVWTLASHYANTLGTVLTAQKDGLQNTRIDCAVCVSKAV